MSDNFGHELRKLRQRYELTLKDLASLVGVSYSLLSKIERGHVTASSRLVNAVSSIFKSKGLADHELRMLHKLGISKGDKSSESRHQPKQLTSTFRFISKQFRSQVLNEYDKKAYLLDLEKFSQAWNQYAVAQDALLSAEWTTAKGALRSAGEHIEHAGDGLKSRIFESLARIHRYEGNMDAALGFLETSRNIYRQLGNNEVRNEIRTLHGLGDILRRRGELEKSEGYYQDALKLSEENNLFHEKSISNRKLAGLFNYRGEAQTSISYADKAIRIANEHSYSEGVWRAKQIKAWSLLMQGNWKKAIELKEECLKIASDPSISLFEKSKSYRYAADGYLTVGMLDKAIEHYERSRELLSEVVGNKLQEESLTRVTLYLSFGRLNLELKNYSEAMSYLNESLMLSYNAGDEFRRGLSHLILGRVYFDIGNAPEAVKQLSQAEKVFEIKSKSSNLYHLVETLIYLSLLELERGNLLQSEAYLSQALQLSDGKYKHLHARSLLVDVLKNIYIGEKTIANAVNCMEQSLEEAEEIGFEFGKRLINDLLVISRKIVLRDTTVLIKIFNKLNEKIRNNQLISNAIKERLRKLAQTLPGEKSQVMIA
jgi:tetratricopeptide (TPR) repeat protein